MTERKQERVEMYRRISPAPAEPWQELPSQPYDRAKIVGRADYEVRTFESADGVWQHTPDPPRCPSGAECVNLPTGGCAPGRCEEESPEVCPTCGSDLRSHCWVMPFGGEEANPAAWADESGVLANPEDDWYRCPDPFHTTPEAGWDEGEELVPASDGGLDVREVPVGTENDRPDPPRCPECGNSADVARPFKFVVGPKMADGSEGGGYVPCDDEFHTTPEKGRQHG